MASRLQLRRGTKTEHESFAGQVGETTVDTTNDDLRVHDGSTVGGKSAAQGNKYDGIKQLDNAPLKDRAQYDVAGFYAGTEVGGGQFIYDDSRDKADHNGGTVITPEAVAAWDGTQANLSVLLDWTGTGTGAFVRDDVHWLLPQYFGAVGDGSTDDTASFKSLIKPHTSIFLPIGEYLVSDTLRERTNSGALRVVGEHRKRSIIKAPGMAKPIIWLGNSNGHGNYRCDLSNFTVDGVDKTPSSVGLILHEAGTSHVRDVDIKNTDVLCKSVGVIGTTIDGKCEWTGGVNGGLVCSSPITGTPASEDDLTTTASPLSLNPNINVFRDIWFSNIEKDAYKITGGLTLLVGATFQGCGNDIGYDVITLDQANESNDYGGGASICNCWVEGGTYRYAIAIRSTRASKIKNNFINGSSSSSGTNKPKEGGIFKSSDSLNTTVKGNSIRGYFVSPPTEGRIDNGAIYTQGTLRREDVFDNYIVTNQTLPYYEGLTLPKVIRGNNDFEIIISDLATAPVVEYDSHGITGTVTKTSAGDYSYTLNFNQSSMPEYPLSLSVRTNSATKSYSASFFGGGQAAGERIIVHDENGALADPRSLVITFKNSWQGI